MSFPDSHSVYRSVHGSPETPSRPCANILNNTNSLVYSDAYTFI